MLLVGFSDLSILYIWGDTASIQIWRSYFSEDIFTLVVSKYWNCIRMLMLWVFPHSFRRGRLEKRVARLSYFFVLHFLNICLHPFSHMLYIYFCMFVIIFDKTSLSIFLPFRKSFNIFLRKTALKRDKSWSLRGVSCYWFYFESCLPIVVNFY